MLQHLSLLIIAFSDASFVFITVLVSFGSVGSRMEFKNSTIVKNILLSFLVDFSVSNMYFYICFLIFIALIRQFKIDPKIGF